MCWVKPEMGWIRYIRWTVQRSQKDFQQKSWKLVNSTITSSYSPNVVCFVFVYHTNMDRLFTKPTRSLIRHAIFSQTGPPRRADCLAPGTITGV